MLNAVLSLQMKRFKNVVGIKKREKISNNIVFLLGLILGLRIN